MTRSPFYLNVKIHYKEQDWLPGGGNGGMEHLESGGKISMFFSAVSPPVIIRPALENCVKYKQR